MKPIFAQTLNSLRREGGLSQKKAAQDLGISQALLSHYENGVREPKLEFVLKACDYYGVTTDHLLGHADQKRVKWDAVLHNENTDVQRCISAGSLILALLSEIEDEQLSGAVASYLSYSLYFVLAALRAPLKPYEPLFDAAIKTAEADLIKTALENDKSAEATAALSDEALKEKYPEQFQTILELDDLIRSAVIGIRNLYKANYN